MPSYIQSFVKTSEDTTQQNLNQVLEEDEDKVNSNDFLSFNCNIGLKARLYQKNKALLDKVIQNEDIQRRDSIDDLFTDL